MVTSLESEVREALRRAPKVASIEELLSLVRKKVDVPEDFIQSASDQRLKGIIRRQIKTFKDADGLAVFESIERPTADGGRERVYAQLSLFDVNEFRQTIDYHASVGSWHCRKANTLTQRCNATHQTQLPLPFPELGTIGDEEEQP